MKLLIHFQTSTMALFVISPHTLLAMELFISAGMKVNSR